MVENEILKKLVRDRQLKALTLKKTELEGTNEIEMKVDNNLDGSITIEFREMEGQWFFIY